LDYHVAFSLTKVFLDRSIFIKHRNKKYSLPSEITVGDSEEVHRISYAMNLYTILKWEKFATGHRYFVSFAETHCSIMSLLEHTELLKTKSFTPFFQNQ
jgi:hypothetical protein